MLVLGRGALSALMIATAAAAAGAQQKACEIEEGTPNQVARAMLDLQMTQTASKPEDAAKALRDAVKLLHEGDLKRNPVGRAFVLGKVLVTWMGQPGMESGVAPRAALGFTTDPTAHYDLIANIDSAFTVVEQSNPDCVAQTTGWRQQKAWVDLVNKAMDLGNQGDKPDSAVMIARRSLTLFRGAPYGYLVLAKVAAEKNQTQEAIGFYKEALGVASKDTSAQIADMRRQVLMTLGNFASDLYEQGTGDKAAMMAEAKAAYEALAKDPGTKYADAARAGQARLAQMSGDTTAIKATYADQLANPGAFSYASLMNAAVTAARTGQTKDAIKLFESARAVNPLHRDVLYNLSRLYLLDSAFAPGLQFAGRLVEIDPNNPDNYQLLQVGYGGISKQLDAKLRGYERESKSLGDKANAARTAAAKKTFIDSAAKVAPLVRAYSDSARAFIDSTLKYGTIASGMPVRVTFTEFTPSDTGVVLGGTLAQTDSSPARDYTVRFKFLDKSGAVLDSATTVISGVKQGQPKGFRVSGKGNGIVAFRYESLLDVSKLYSPSARPGDLDEETAGSASQISAMRVASRSTVAPERLGPDAREQR